ncbi:Uncharacterised protein [uncultured archaeon]|nr:Uncharacterised protein [uncultured archaeon]
MIQLLVAIIVVLLGFPIGIILSKLTKEELKGGEKWFKLLVFLAAITAIFGLFTQNDPLFFSSLFLIAVTSQSIGKKKH